jgi:Ca2+-binding EF-hand superfamily protein
LFERDCPSGFVSIKALEHALTTYGTERLALADARELLAQLEPDDKGMINYIDFVNMMTGA